MFLKFFIPKNSSLRFRVNINKKILNLKKFKRLFYSQKNNSGRNNSGQITVRHIGGGLFNFRRKVDIYRDYKNNENKVFALDIDKKYSSFLGLIKYKNGCYLYILAPHELVINQQIGTTFLINEATIGYSLPLGWMSNNSIINTVEIKPCMGGKYIRRAGVFGTVIMHFEETVLVKLPSKKLKHFSKYCMATLGRMSNILHFLKSYGKAGISRYFNERPTVRGETMNPIDHPNGGRTRGGKPRKNPWGKIIK